MQSDYNVLVGRINEISQVTNQLQLSFQDSFGKFQDHDWISKMSDEVMKSACQNIATIISR